MIEILLKILLAIACAAILWRVEPTLANMSPCTNWRIRYSMLLIAAGAAWGLLESMGTGHPPESTVILSIGIAFLMISERRLRHLFKR